MSTFKKILSAFVTVEDAPPSGTPSSTDIEAVLASTRAALGKPAPPTTPEPVMGGSPPVEAPAPGSTLIKEGRDWAEIYMEANIPSANYNAEKLLRVLDGLTSMPEDARKLAVRAMDAADDSWTIEDPVRDAEAKIMALKSEQERLSTAITSEEAQCKVDLAAQDTYLTEATAAFRQQIAELQAQLEAEISSVSKAKSEREAAARAAREAAARESARVGQEISRLSQVTKLFGAMVQTPTSTNPTNPRSN